MISHKHLEIINENPVLTVLFRKSIYLGPKHGFTTVPVAPGGTPYYMLYLYAISMLYRYVHRDRVGFFSSQVWGTRVSILNLYSGIGHGFVWNRVWFPQ